MHLAFAFLLTIVSIVNALILPRDNQTSSIESSPNPIAQKYPNNITGTINGTLAVIPIPYGLARNLIPSQYGILTSAYESLLPGFPPNSYPVRFTQEPTWWSLRASQVVLKFILDHDLRVEAFNISIPDFQVSITYCQ
jgi:hypothetical protein